MGKTFKRPAIKQHKLVREYGEFSHRVENNKKKQNKNKHPKRELIEELDWTPQEIRAFDNEY